MADLRRWIIALAVLSLFAGLASAQVAGGGSTTLQCALQAQPTPTLRTEGITEEIGDILIICTGGNPVQTAFSQTSGTLSGVTAGQVPQTNITVSLTSQVTSRLLGNGVNWSEALLLIDEPGTAVPGSNVTPLIPGTGPAAPIKLCPTPNTGCPNYTQLVTNPTPGGPAIPVATNCVPNTTGTTVTGTTAIPVCSTTTGTTPTPTQLGYNAFQGIVSGNQVTFFGVPILAPGTASSRALRITNVRVNASGIGGGSASGSVPVQASLLSGNPFALPLSQATPIVGFVQTGLVASASGAATFGQCNTQPQTSSGLVAFGASQATLLAFTEGFGSAFKTRVDPFANGGGLGSGQNFVIGSGNQMVPGTPYNSESGLIVPITYAAPFFPVPTIPAGLADSGTRLKAVFNNLPAGAHLFVSATNVNRDITTGAVTSAVTAPTTGTSTTGYAVLLTSGAEAVTDTATGAPAATPSTTVNTIYTVNGSVAGFPLVDITPTSGSSASAVWEVINTNPDAIETLRFAAFVAFTASPGTNTPATGATTVNLSFAPTSTVTTASAGPIPRFIDTSTGKTGFNINACRTALLFPFVTNQVGFDTGLAISNTSTDPFGTTPQAGTCSLNWYGATAPATSTTPSIPTATSYVTLASTAAPNFQGYMIAVCNFQYAHGFAFISDVGAQKLAMGYLALIIPDPALNGGRLNSDLSKSVPSSGEQLGN